jgi:hypothetical protein
MVRYFLKQTCNGMTMPPYSTDSVLLHVQFRLQTHTIERFMPLENSAVITVI